MAKCDRCSDELHDYPWALVPGKRKSIEQVCRSCLTVENFPELKGSKYLPERCWQCGGSHPASTVPGYCGYRADASQAKEQE